MKQKRIIGILLALTMVLASVFGHMSAEAYAASKVRLNKKSFSMAIGGKYALKVNSLPQNAKVTWTSSDPGKATVSRKGVVRAKKAGSVIIRARAVYRQNGKKKTVKLSSRIRIRNYRSVEGRKIKMSTKNISSLSEIDLRKA